jgi:hypothetical protein
MTFRAADILAQDDLVTGNLRGLLFAANKGELMFANPPSAKAIMDAIFAARFGPLQ